VTLSAATILDSAATTLLDTSGRTWSADEKLGYLNEALRATAFVKPDMYVVQTPFTLAAGEQQVLPTDGVALIDIPRNTGGRVITQVDKGLLDEANRFWPAATQEVVVEHFTEDPRNPRRFVVYPPNDGTGVVDLIYGAVPPQVMYAAEEIDIPASYEAPMIQYVLSRCWAKNSKRQDLAKSADCKQQWGTLLGVKSQGQVAVAPKVAAQPGTDA
jgi:hypothetical protein